MAIIKNIVKSVKYTPRRRFSPGGGVFSYFHELHAILRYGCIDDVLRVGFSTVTGTATVSVFVIDVNDNAPQFNHANYDARVTENQRAGVVVARPWASDLDAGRNADVRFD